MLTRVLEDAALEPIFLETAKALAAVEAEGVAKVLTKYSKDPVTEVRRTSYIYQISPPTYMYIYMCGRHVCWPWT